MASAADLKVGIAHQCATASSSTSLRIVDRMDLAFGYQETVSWIIANFYHDVRNQQSEETAIPYFLCFVVTLWNHHFAGHFLIPCGSTRSSLSKNRSNGSSNLIRCDRVLHWGILRAWGMKHFIFKLNIYILKLTWKVQEKKAKTPSDLLFKLMLKNRKQSAVFDLVIDLMYFRWFDFDIFNKRRT